MEITHTLNKAQADALFAEHAVFMGGKDVVFVYKAAELFGPDVMAWAERCMKHDGYMKPGNDWDGWGSGCNGDGISFFCESGFKKLVSQCNAILATKEHRASEGGKMWDSLWEARCARLDAEDAEDQRRREERKAKRAAARKAKQEAAEQEISRPENANKCITTTKTLAKIADALDITVDDLISSGTHSTQCHEQTIIQSAQNAAEQAASI